MFVEMKNASCFGPGVVGTTVNQAFLQLIKGDAVMSYMASAQMGSLHAIDASFQPGWFPLPADNPKETRTIVVANNMLAVNKATAYPAQARTFIDFLARPKQASLFTKITGFVSDYDFKTCALTDANVTAFRSVCKNGATILSQTGAWRNQNMSLGYLPPALVGLITGQRTVAQILKDFDYLWDNPDAASAPG
jgi:raffinose/stachyose/melibiose transport system substrate-binding protein